MTNWLVSFETFTMATKQVSRLRKKLYSLSSANQIRENNRSAKANVLLPRHHAGVICDDSGVDFQNTSEFSQKLPIFCLNFSDTNQNNQSGRLTIYAARRKT